MTDEEKSREIVHAWSVAMGLRPFSDEEWSARFDVHTAALVMLAKARELLAQEPGAVACELPTWQELADAIDRGEGSRIGKSAAEVAACRALEFMREKVRPVVLPTREALTDEEKALGIYNAGARAVGFDEFAEWPNLRGAPCIRALAELDEARKLIIPELVDAVRAGRVVQATEQAPASQTPALTVKRWAPTGNHRAEADAHGAFVSYGDYFHDTLALHKRLEEAREIISQHQASDEAWKIAQKSWQERAEKAEREHSELVGRYGACKLRLADADRELAECKGERDELRETVARFRQQCELASAAQSALCMFLNERQYPEHYPTSWEHGAPDIDLKVLQRLDAELEAAREAIKRGAEGGGCGALRELSEIRTTAAACFIPEWLEYIPTRLDELLFPGSMPRHTAARASREVAIRLDVVHDTQCPSAGDYVVDLRGLRWEVRSLTRAGNAFYVDGLDGSECNGMMLLGKDKCRTWWPIEKPQPEKDGK